MPRVTRILRRASSLETLSLFFFPEPHPLKNPWDAELDKEGHHAARKLRYNEHVVACLRERVKEINLVHYQGAMAQRALAKFLLRNAPVVDEVCCDRSLLRVLRPASGQYRPGTI